MILWLTRSYLICIVSLFSQIINIALLFRIHLEEAIKQMSADRFTEILSQCLTLGLFAVAVAFGFMFHTNSRSIKEKNILLSSSNDNCQNDFLFNSEKLVSNLLCEVKSLIQTILGSLELLLKHIEAGLGAKLVKIAIVATENLNRIIYNMVHVNEKDMEKLESETSPTNVNNLFKSIWDTTSILLQKKELEGNLKINPELPTNIEIDSKNLKQVILNIVDYLLQITPKGCINAAVEYTEPTLDEDYEEFEALRKNSATFNSINMLYPVTERSTDYLKELNSPVSLKSKPRIQKTLKVTLRNEFSKTGCGNINNQFKEVTQERLALPINSDMAKLDLHMSKVICEKVGGQLKAYTRREGETALVIQFPFDVSKNKQFKRGGCQRLY